MADRKLFIGLDVGGTSVKMGLFDEAGELLGKGSVPTPPLIDSAGYTAVTDGITALLGAASEQAEQVRGIGLAIPCPVPADGVIRMQANIQINAPGLQAALERHCPNAAVRSGGVQGREPPRHGLAHAGKQEGRVGPAALGEIRKTFVLRPERIG